MKITKLSRNETRKVAVSVVITAILFLSMTAIVPVSAADPSVNADTWFVLTLQSGVGKNVTYPGNGVTHIEANNTWAVMRSPQTAGTVQIGIATSQLVCDFSNVTSTGAASYKFLLNLTETNSTKNPYGVGTIGVSATVALTSLGTPTFGLNIYPGNGIGTLTSTTGTGAFASAKLYGDLVMNPLFVGPLLSANGYTEALFFGTHARVSGTGVLVYYPALAASAFSSVTVMRGLTWNFFVQSTGGVGPWTYQWYEGSSLLTGQNSMILSMNKAAAGTYTYTCKVTDSYGYTATTNVITMTVL